MLRWGVVFPKGDPPRSYKDRFRDEAGTQQHRGPSVLAYCTLAIVAIDELYSTEMLALALACLTLHATPSVLPLRSSMMRGARTSFPTRTEMVTNGGNRSRVVSLAMEKPTVGSGDSKKGRFFLPVVFTALSVACALALGRTMSLQPLYPFKTDSLSWRE